MKHKCKDQTRLLDKALATGLFRNKPTADGGVLYPMDRTRAPHVWHYGERGYHELRRYVKKFGVQP